MPSIIIEIGETEHKQLREEYDRVCASWSKSEDAPPLPRFEQWAGHRLKNADGQSAAGFTSGLKQAYQRLVDRTMIALDHLGSERAIGRAEGAMAILVSMQAIEREAAQKKTQAFKANIRNAKKAA